MHSPFGRRTQMCWRQPVAGARRASRERPLYPAGATRVRPRSHLLMPSRVPPTTRDMEPGPFVQPRNPGGVLARASLRATPRGPRFEGHGSWRPARRTAQGPERVSRALWCAGGEGHCDRRVACAGWWARPRGGREQEGAVPGAHPRRQPVDAPCDPVGDPGKEQVPRQEGEAERPGDGDTHNKQRAGEHTDQEQQAGHMTSTSGTHALSLTLRKIGRMPRG